MASPRLAPPSNAMQTLSQDGGGSPPSEDKLTQIQSEAIRFAQLRCRYMALQSPEPKDTRESFWKTMASQVDSRRCGTPRNRCSSVYGEHGGRCRSVETFTFYGRPYIATLLSDWAAEKKTYDQIASLYLEEKTRYLHKAGAKYRISGWLKHHADLLVTTLTKLNSNQLRDELAKHLVRDECVPFLKKSTEAEKTEFYQTLVDSKALPYPYEVELATKLGLSPVKSEDKKSLPGNANDVIAVMPEEEFFEHARRFAQNASLLLNHPDTLDSKSREIRLSADSDAMYAIEWRYQEIIHRMERQRAIAIAASLPDVCASTIHRLSGSFTISSSQAEQKDFSIFDEAPTENYVPSFKHESTPKNPYIEKLSAYIRERKHAAQIKKSEYLSRWGFFTRMSCTNKTNAAEKILALLEGKPLSSPFTKAELAALRDSRLGKIISDCERDHLLPAAFQEAERNNTLLRYFRR
jgi:hypothetical protein